MTHPNVQYFSQQSWKTITVHSVHNATNAFMYIVHIKDLSRFLFLCSGTIRNGLLKTIYGLGDCKYIYTYSIYHFTLRGQVVSLLHTFLLFPNRKSKKEKKKISGDIDITKKGTFCYFLTGFYSSIKNLSIKS